MAEERTLIEVLESIAESLKTLADCAVIEVNGTYDDAPLPADTLDDEL